MIKKIKLFLLKMKIAIYEYQLKKIAKDYWEELEYERLHSKNR